MLFLVSERVVLAQEDNLAAAPHMSALPFPYLYQTSVPLLSPTPRPYMHPIRSGAKCVDCDILSYHGGWCPKNLPGPWHLLQAENMCVDHVPLRKPSSGGLLPHHHPRVCFRDRRAHTPSGRQPRAWFDLGHTAREHCDAVALAVGGRALCMLSCPCFHLEPL